MIELPVKKVKASRKSPKNMIIYGPPKIGKTTVLSQLDDCLIIDLEDGSDMVDALKVKVKNLKELDNLYSEGAIDEIVSDYVSKIEYEYYLNGKKIKTTEI
jgi:replication-associated recombination protein RarA